MLHEKSTAQPLAKTGNMYIMFCDNNNENKEKPVNTSIPTF